MQFTVGSDYYIESLLSNSLSSDTTTRFGQKNDVLICPNFRYQKHIVLYI